MDGIIFDIQRFSVNDGPGIRTSVFFKGCPLRCAWCHNPESQRGKREILYYEHKCKGCGGCSGISDCDFDFMCPNDARVVCGRSADVEQIIAEVKKDEIFYETSGGGITLSGGEPLAQATFAVEILKSAKENGIHSAIETCGYASEDAVRSVAQYTDLFLFDFKETDPELHKKFTGVDNAIILKNLRLIDSLGKDIILRCPIIPGYNAREDHYDAIANLANSLKNVKRIDIEPYHALGLTKYKALGLDTDRIIPPSDDEVARVIDYISKKTQVKVAKA